MSNPNKSFLRLEWLLNTLPTEMVKDYVALFNLSPEMVNELYETRAYPVSDDDAEWGEQ